jgi:hypothetical protein
VKEKEDTGVDGEGEANGGVLRREIRAEEQAKELEDGAREGPEGFRLGLGAQEHRGHAQYDQSGEGDPPREEEVERVDVRIQQQALTPPGSSAARRGRIRL